MKKDERGIAVIAVIAAVAVIGVLGFVGYRVYDAQQPKDTKTATESSSQNTSESAGKIEAQAKIWSKGAAAVPGKYADADVITLKDGSYRMYYAIQPEVRPNNFEVFSATSTDGKTWKEESGIRKTMATFPDVITLKDGTYRMYFQSAGVIKSAISSDGLTFKDESGIRIDKTNNENLALDNVAAPSVVQQDDGTFIMVYRGSINQRYAQNTPNPSTNILLWAKSTDGLTFTKQGIAIDSRNETLAGQLDGPDLIKWDSGKWKLFATSYTGVYEFDFDGSKFSQNGTLAYAAGAKKDGRGFSGQPPGDPTLQKIGGSWYMYYGQTGAETGIHYAILQ